MVIDTNEPNILFNNSISQLLQRTNLIDIIDEVHGLYKVPNTYISGSHRIDFFLATKYISTFIDRSGITSFNEVTTSDHRGKFINLHLRDFLKNSYASISNASSRTLQSTNTKNVVKYKQHLKHIVINKLVIEKAKIIQVKLITNSITPNDFTKINELDNLLTSGMLKVERMIVRDEIQYSWSPTLAIAILQLFIWKLIKSELKTKTSRQTKLQQITIRLHNLDTQFPSSLISYKHNNMKSIKKKTKTLKNTLKTTKKNSRVLRDTFLKERIIEDKLDDNQKHVTYLNNLLIIEH